MSYVVSVWESPAGPSQATSLDQAMKERDAMFDRPDSAEPNAKLVKLGHLLQARYPDHEDGDGDGGDSFWTDGSAQYAGTSPVWNIGIATNDRLDEVQAVLVTYATALGLNVFDDQAAEAHLPEGRVFSLGDRGPCVKGLAALHLARYPVALAEFQRLGAAGNPLALRQLGLMFERGLGVAADRAEAERWYRRAALAGDAQAKSDAQHLAADRSSAMPGIDTKRLRELAASSDPKDHGFLGRIHEEGAFGTPQNPVEALHWYRKSAEAGDNDAQYQLARMYALGLGVTADNAQSIHWAEKAAAGGHVQAQYNLAISYRDGDDVPVDLKKALRLFAAAATQRHADATFSIGSFYREGLGAPQDHGIAEAFFHLSDLRGGKLQWVKKSGAEDLMRIPRLVEELGQSHDILATIESWPRGHFGRVTAAAPIGIDENRFHWGHAALLIGIVAAPFVLLIQPDPPAGKRLLIAGLICGFAGVLRTRTDIARGTGAVVLLAISSLVPLLGSAVCGYALVQSLRKKFG